MIQHPDRRHAPSGRELWATCSSGIARSTGVAGLLAAAILALGLSWASPASAQGASAPSAFVERVEVQLVNVEVWVSDKDGDLVHGLGIEDFEIFEDGKPVPISHFSEVRRERRRASSSPEPLTASAPVAAAEPEPASDAAPPRLVIYFDFSRLGATNRKRLTRDLRDFLAEGAVPPEDILILRQRDDLEIAAPFGSTDEELAAALSKLEQEATQGAALETRLAVERLQQLWVESQINSSFGDPCAFFTRRAAPQVDQLARQGRARNEATLSYLAEVSAFLAGLPGVKTLLYLGDALSTTPGGELIAFVESVCPSYQQNGQAFRVPEDMGEVFHNLTRHANANRVTIYTLQTTGLTTGFLGSASEPAVDFRGTGNITAFDSTLRAAERGGLALIAAETGGRATFNVNRFDTPLERMSEEMSSYYSLAYAPPHGGDGLQHRIEVRVRDPQLEVRHRQGYRDKGADERMAERVEGAAFLGIVSNPLGARLGAGTVQTLEGRTLRLPLHVLVPAKNVVFLPGDGGATAQLMVQVSARDVHNRRVLWDQRPFGVAAVAEAGNQLIDLSLDLDLKEGEYVVAVGLRDEVSGEASFLATTVALRAGSEVAGGR